MVRTKLLGVNVDSISEDEVYEKIMKLTEIEKPSQVILLDTKLLMRAVFCKEIRDVINNADLVIPISKNIRGALKFLKTDVESIYNFFSFTIRIINHSCDYHKFVYFLGGRKNQMKRIEKNIRDSFPGIRFVGNFHTHYKKNFEDKLLLAMRKAGAHIIIISMKRPKLERWIYSNKSKFKNGVFIGVENFVEIVGGGERAPTDEEILKGVYSLQKALTAPFGFLRIFDLILFNILVLFERLSGNR